MNASRSATKRIARFPGGQAPLGYARTDGGGLRPLAREAALVRTIFREYPRRKSLGNLAGWLKKQGLRNRGREWTRPTLAWILRNPVYIGTLRIGRARWRAACEPLVDTRAFAAVQRQLTGRCRNPRRGRNHEAPPTLAQAAPQAAQPRAAGAAR